MTGEQIIKANKLCAMPTSILCEECPYHHLRDTDSDCVEVMTNDTVDLINRLQADKEGLINGQISLQKALAEKFEESENQSQNFKVLISDHRTLHQSFDNLKGLYEAEKARVEMAKKKCIGFAKELQTAKAELKETTEKFNCQQYVYADLSNIIKEKNAEIERLKEQDETAEKIIREQGGTILHLKDENSRLFDRNCELSEKGEKAVIACIATRNEAIKEFAERLKAKAFTHEIPFESNEDKFIKLVAVNDINNLVKEMAGDTE